MAKARILAVDDQRYFRELIAGMLADEGYEAQTASSGEEALQVLEKTDFDVVLTDLVMPGMDGTELVQRIKERDPEQEVLVVTGVVDVKTAVDAMKVGASDYLLKPFDRRTLDVTLETLLRGKRLRAEHGRLLAENIEYIGERSLYERALGLFSAPGLEPLAMRIADALCQETRAQGGVVWLAGEPGGERLELAAARGLVRLADEAEVLDPEGLPPELREGARAALTPGGAEPGALFVALRRGTRELGIVRLTDKLEAEGFDDVDRTAAEKLARFAEVAVANAIRLRSLERRGLRDPSNGAYHADYFRDVVRNEIEKAGRFGRSFALLQVELGSPRELREVAEGEDLERWLASVSDHLRSLLRATDLLAIDEARRLFALLPEADALGAAALKRRALRELMGGEAFTGLDERRRPHPRAGLAIFPTDGTQLEGLMRCLDTRTAEARQSRAELLGLERLPLGEALRSLVQGGARERPEMAGQIARFLLGEVGRRPRERGLLYAAPGAALAEPLREGLEALRDLPLRTELVVVSDGERPSFPVPAVNWVSPRRAPGLPPCLIHYGSGPAYALVREDGEAGAPAQLFHTGDRGLVEHLAFRLQEQLAVPAAVGIEDLP